MSLAVADTSPLNYLISINLAEVLPKLFEVVLVAREVLNELLSLDAPSAVRIWAKEPPRWVRVVDSASDPTVNSTLARLHQGERAAINLALSNQPSTLLIDERAGTMTARNLGLQTTGTLGLLDNAAQQRLISLPDAIHRLTQTSFRYPKRVVARLLREDAAR